VSVDVRQLVDGEEQELAKIRFGRNRFLRTVGVALFAFATQLVSPQEASAAHGYVPWPCHGANICHCCSGASCCESGCKYDGYCWYVVVNCATYKCCDWINSNDKLCICRSKVCSCC
jgi:hypothetical protein